MERVVIVDALRTAFSRFGGALREVPSVQLGAQVLAAVLERGNVPKDAVGEVFYGTCVTAEHALDMNILGRQALLKAGLPPETLSLTLDRACCSSTTALSLAFRAIASGEMDCAVSIGSENMSRTPFLAPGLRFGRGLGPVTLSDPLHRLGYEDWNPVAVDAGEVALEHGIGREEQDAFALRSQQRYQAALTAGLFDEEILPIEVPQPKGPPQRFARDEFPKPETTMEGLARLKTIYGSPTVTAGNAPGLEAGASAILLMREETAAERGLAPLGRVLSVASVALRPDRMAEAPAPAIRKALSRAGLGLDDMARLEINEAFAAVPLVATRVLAGEDDGLCRSLLERLNVHGGAVAIGHPVGASGGRIVMTLLRELRRLGAGSRGVAAICGGLGQGDAVVVEAMGGGSR